VSANSSEPVAVAPDTQDKLGSAANGDGKKQADTKKDAKEKSKIDSHASERASPQHYYNYYDPRH
jgi:hypothetical protein